MVEHGETPEMRETEVWNCIIGDLQITPVIGVLSLDQANSERQERGHNPNPPFLGNLIPVSSKCRVCLN